MSVNVSMKAMSKLILLGVIVLNFGLGMDSTRAASITEPAPVVENTYHYSARIPQTTLSCEEEARALGEGFTAATGIPVVEAVCSGVVNFKANDDVTYPLYSLLIAYRAVAEVRPYSAILGGLASFDEPDSSAGVYSSFAECVADIKNQKANFEAQTALRAIAASCSVPTLEFAGNYILKMDGFGGSPKKRLHVYNLDFFEGKDPSVQNQVRDFVTQLGGAVVYQSDTMFFYYAEQKVVVGMHRFGTVANKGECETQLGEVNQIMTLSGYPYWSVKCSDGVAGSSEMTGLGVDYGYHLYTDYLESVSAPPTYFSFSECMADHARARSDEAARWLLVQPILGAICQGKFDEAGHYELRFYRAL